MSNPELEAVRAELKSVRAELESMRVERDHAQKELEATHAALVEAEKRAATGLLSAGVAHDLNSPLSSILLNCHMLRMPTLDREEHAKCINVIETTTERMKDIVKALFTFARPAPDRSPGEPAKALADSLLLMRKLLQPVIVDAPASEVFIPPVLLSTSDLMRVLTNLLQNARHAVDKLGSDGHISVTAEVEPNHVIMRVTDNGVGIPAEVRDSIWKPFFTTKADGQGAGLGLSLVRSLVEQAQGQIDVERSGPGGTTFRVDLRRADVR